MKNKIIILLMFLSSVIYSSESFTYLIYVKNIDSVTIGSLKEFGYTDIFKVYDGQPFRITSLLQPANTNYMLLYIQPKNDDELNTLVSLENSNKIVKIIGQDTYKDAKGNIKVKVNKYNSLPIDIDKDFSVIKSS